MKVELTPLAQEDVDQALIYLAADNPNAADDLLNDILHKLQQIGQFPQTGSELVIPSRYPRRYLRVYAHPYVIYYRIRNDAVIVMRVLHERMDLRRYI